VACSCNHMTEFTIIAGTSCDVAASAVNGGYMFVFAAYAVSAMGVTGLGLFSFARKSGETGAACGMIVASFIARMVVAFYNTNASSMIAAAVNIICIVPFAIGFFTNARIFERARVQSGIVSPLKFSNLFTVGYLVFAAGAVVMGAVTGMEGATQADTAAVVIRVLAAFSGVTSLIFFANALGLKAKVDSVLTRVSILSSLSVVATSVAWLAWMSHGAAVAAFLPFDLIWAGASLYLHRAAAKQAAPVPSKAAAPTPALQVPVETA